MKKKTTTKKTATKKTTTAKKKLTEQEKEEINDMMLFESGLDKLGQETDPMLKKLLEKSLSSILLNMKNYVPERK